MGWKLATVLMNLLGIIAISVGGANFAMTMKIDAKVERHLGEHEGLFQDDWRTKIQDNHDRIIRLEERLKTDSRL